MLKRCKQCGKECKLFARGMCRSCYMKEFREEKKSQGICTHCFSRPIDFSVSSTHCSTCYYKGKLAYSKLKEQRIRDRCCVDCGKYTGGEYRCETCSIRNYNYSDPLINTYDELHKVQTYLEKRVIDESKKL